MRKPLLTLLSLFIFLNAYPWGNDVLVGPLPSGKISVVATNISATLYCSIPSVVTGQAGVGIYRSTDMGDTWTLVTNPAIGATVLKSKMVVTGTDSIYCMYQIGHNLFTYSIAGNVVTPFTNISVDDFDVVASPNSNSLYLFCDDIGNNNIHRYSSIDGGYTWTGSTSLVSGQAAHPRLYMTGTRLIVNYYGPVELDTTTSTIRSAFYNETSPGQITAGTFLNLLPSGTHHNQFASVIIDSKVWMVYTEGVSAQSIKYMVSTDNGASFGQPVTLVDSTIQNAQCFDAIHYSSGFDSGIQMIYYADSLPAGKSFQFVYASTSSPTIFSSPDRFSDFEGLCADSITPALTNVLSYSGALFVETDSTFSATYFDKTAAPTRIHENENTTILNAFPNPANEFITISRGKNSETKMYFVSDISGKILKTFELNQSNTRLYIGDFESGIYFLFAKGERGLSIVKL